MATIGGPNTEKDNLVFGYDTGYGVADNTTATRFYPGEDTTNVVTNRLPTTGWGTANAQGSTITRTFLSENGIPFMRFSNVTNGSDYPRVTDSVFDNSVTVTGTFSTSLEVRGTQGATLRFRIYQNGSTKITNTITLTSEWVRYTFDSQTTTFNLNQPYFNPATTGATYDIRNIQIEAKGHSTPFVNGTRSNTASLIDLKKTRSINISGASFDSTGQPVFDGTDDVVNLGTNFDFNNKSFSVEAIIKWDGGSQDTFFSYRDSAGGTQKDIHWRIYTSGQLRFDFYSNSINSSAGSIVADEYVHLITTYNFGSDSCICYKNGEVLMAGSSGPFLGNDANSTAYVGAWGTIQRFGGEIPILKIYNSAISASEVKQNFNAYKNRFNI